MDRLSPSQKGAAAELAIAARAVELGAVVLRPMTEGVRYDLVFDIGGPLLRVQCKWAAVKNEVITIPTRTCRHTPRHGYRRTTYGRHEVDLIAAYCAELQQVYVLPIELAAGQTFFHLRLSPARNNQQRRVHWAVDYELGAIAQLGERLHGMQEVAGSSPASST